MTDNENKNGNGELDDFFKDDAEIDDFFSKLQGDNAAASAKPAADEHKSSAADKPEEKSRTKTVYTSKSGTSLKAYGSGAHKAPAPKKKSGFAALLDKIGIDLDKIKKNGGSKKSEPIDDEPEKPISKSRRVWRTIGKVVLVMACICIIIGCVLSVAVAVYLVDATANDDQLLNLDEIKLSYSTILYAQNKESGEWEEYERIYGDENRVWINYADMPQCLIDSAIAVEDETFETHHGVNWKRTVAAFINQYVIRIWESTQGGSTITQQLIKNITNEKAVGGIEGPLRKVREIYRALVLEKKYTKDQIMEAYLNTFRLSGQLAGVESAANYFFGKTTSELTPAESAAIVCITKNPTDYNPLTEPEANKKRREDTVLWLMNQQGLLNDEEYHAALEQSATLTFHEGDVADENHVYSYFTDTVIDQVLDDLQKYNNMSAEAAYTLFSEGGLKIYLTIDTEIQSAMEEYAFNPENWPDLKYEDDGVTPLEDKLQMNAAMVVMDYNANLLGIIGGVRSKDESRGLNRAYESTRSPGSSFKPLAVYAPALELNYINYSTAIADEPMVGYFDDAKNNGLGPENFDNVFGRLGTSVPIYRAVGTSLNTVAVRVLKMVGPDTAFGFCENKFGISTLVDVEDGLMDDNGKFIIDKTLSLGLGGLTNGVSPYEMCAAYVPFGNGGTYKTPHSYTKVVDSRGNVLLDTEQTNQTIQSISEQTAYVMNKMLQYVATNGTATQIRQGKLPLAAKTGTSSDNKDFWIVALNPYYVMSIWQGYDEPAYMYQSQKVTAPAVKSVLGTISEGLEYKDFPAMPSGVYTATICTASGDLASEACPDKATGYYKTGYGPTETCNHALAPIVEEKSLADYAAIDIPTT